MKRILIFASLSALAMALPMSADILYSDLGTGSDVYSSIGSSSVAGTLWQADSFTVSGTGDFLLNQIDLGVQINGVADPAFAASIWTDASGLPGTELGSWDLTATAESCCGLTTESGITGVTLTGGTLYWMVLQGKTDSSVIWDVGGAEKTSNQLASDNSGGSWTSYKDQGSMAFDAIGTSADSTAAAPEPGSVVLVGTGIAGLLGFVGLRRRSARQS